MTAEYVATVTPADGRWHEGVEVREDGTAIRYRWTPKATVRNADGTETVTAVLFTTET
ncbi:hypothetical protein M2280_004094 [Prescottella agglutinans]|uniref:Uncharacterized protein n=1 Tax=Prescottella agglutinans TaxID=1644129 RepID=A0ABT6MEV7_9NOCA|nr:hypothetical protein [Prescottella agglutinans]